MTERLFHDFLELPPRARRIPTKTRKNTRKHGTTSACAENTLRLPDHISGRWELPPRARRILDKERAGVSRNGTTSACAENTWPWRCFRKPLGNYLRVRGEYHRYHFFGLYRWELPPRARRIPATVSTRVRPPGTTSACAENTILHAPFDWAIGNYLRVRGEYLESRLSCSVTPELPPRARRILNTTSPRLAIRRTTSACAENTIPRPSVMDHEGNYLRVRGEY